MTYMQNGLAFAGGIQELTVDEIGYVNGGSVDAPPGSPLLDQNSTTGERISEYFTTAATAACSYLAKSMIGAVACAVGGEAVKEASEELEKYPPTDPMDTKLGINTGK